MQVKKRVVKENIISYCIGNVFSGYFHKELWTGDVGNKHVSVGIDVSKWFVSKCTFRYNLSNIK